MMFLTRRRNKKSNVNLSHVSPTTLAPGNLVPISFTRIIAGDDLRFKPSAFVQAMPMNAPLVNGFKLCLEYFFVPDRLYNWDLLVDNTGVTNDPDTVQFPLISAPTGNALGTSVIKLGADDDFTHSFISNIVAPGSLADYCGFPVGMIPTFAAADDRNKFSALKMLGVMDIFYNYYVNQQVVTFPTASYSPYSTASHVEQNVVYDVSVLRSFLDYVKRSKTPATAISKWVSSLPPTPSGSRVFPLASWEWFCSRASIFQRCLPPYYLESWLATSGYEDSEIKVDLDTDGKSISFRNISAQSHIQRWLDLALAGGSRYSDYLNSQFDVSRLKHTTSPLFLGSDRQYLGSNVIYQTTGAGDSSSPLGAFAGQTSGGETFRQRSYHFGENGYFVVMASLVPDVIYSRGLDPFNREKTLADVYVPALDNIAMQPLMVEELDAVQSLVNLTYETFPAGDTTFTIGVTPDSKTKNSAVGFVPAWSQLMQNVSRSHGRLVTDLKYWLLNRDYGMDASIVQDAKVVSQDFFQKITAAIKEGLTEGFYSFEEVEALTAALYRIQYKPNYSPYILPNAYNDVFADVSNQAQNFVLTCTFSMSCNREKGKVNTPTTI